MKGFSFRFACLAVLSFLLFSTHSSVAYACGLFSGCGSNQYCDSPLDPLGNGTCRTRGSAGSSCTGLGQGTCSSNLVCDIIGECRHSPSESGEPCGTGVSCASGLSCSALVGGRCQAPRSAGQSCIGLGQGNCASNLVCDVSGECRHSPPQSGEPCGTGVSCASGLNCSALVGGRCQAPRSAGESCFGIGQGNCASDLVCDVLGECRHSPPESGEPCGTGVACAAGLGCSADIAGRCQALGESGDACSGVGQGSCAEGLVCDALRECRHETPELGERCGAGVGCVSGLVCSDIAAGYCQRRSGSTEPCWGIGQGTCQDNFVCDVLLECRRQPPQRGELCGRGVPCAEGLACSSDIAGRCGTPRKVGERCTGFGQGNCVDDSSCMLSRNPDDGELFFQCYPNGESAIPEDTCLSFYSSGLHQASRDLGTALTFGTATGLAAGAATSIEIGTVYGPEGQYGCYDTTCVGALTNAGATPIAVCAGLYNTYDIVGGDSVASVESVSPVPGRAVAFSTAQVFPQLGSIALIGTADCLSVSVGVLPLDVGVYQCTTNLATYQQDSNNDGIIDFKASELQLDVSLPSGDTDADGIRDVIEVGGDIDYPLDSDGDGIIDALEAGNAAINAAVANGLTLIGGDKVDIATAPGRLLSRVGAAAASNPPAGVEFPFGMLSYTTTADPGGSVDVTLTFSGDLPAAMALYKVDHAGNYAQLPANVWRQTGTRSLLLTLTDGDPATDLDGAVDGYIEDPLAVGRLTPAAFTSDNGGGGGGGCSIGSHTRFDPTLLLLPLLIMGYRFRCRRSGRDAPR